eukprot:jgi/Antlo1/616/2405
MQVLRKHASANRVDGAFEMILYPKMNVLRESILSMCRMKLNLDLGDTICEDEVRAFVVEHLKSTCLFKLQGQCKHVIAYESIKDYAGDSLEFYHPVQLKVHVTNKYVHDRLKVDDHKYVLNISPCEDKRWIESQLSSALSQIYLLEMAKIRSSAESALEKENTFLKVRTFIKRVTKQGDTESKETPDCLFISGNFAAAKKAYKDNRRHGGKEIYCSEMSMYCSMLMGSDLELQWTADHKMMNSERHVRILYFLIEYYKATKISVPGHVLMLYLKMSNVMYAACKSFFTLELIKIADKKRRLFLPYILEAMVYFKEKKMKRDSDACWKHMLSFEEIRCFFLKMELQTYGHTASCEELKQGAGFISERMIVYLNKLRQDVARNTNTSQGLL